MRENLSIISDVIFANMIVMDFESMEKNKESAMKIYQAMESGNYEGLENYIAEDIKEHSPDPFVQGSGLEYVKNVFKEYKRIFPDLKVKINDMVAEGNKLAVYITITGTHSGEIMGKTPGNKKVTVEGIDLVHFKNGKVSDYWGVWDYYSMMTQTGIIFEEIEKTKA